jgi:hypothetical protein
MGKSFKMYSLLTILIFKPLMCALTVLSVVVWTICMLDLLFLDHFRRAVYLVPLMWIVWSVYKFRKNKKKLLEEYVI